jgi:exopolysaccharide biosynthesis polyprenyl glycosylphosphotransferase
MRLSEADRPALPVLAGTRLSRSTGRARWARNYVALMVGTDLLAVVVAVVTAYMVRFGEVASPNDARDYTMFSVVLPVLWLTALGLCGAYDSKAVGIGSDEFARVFRAAVGLTAVIAIVSYASKAEIARGYVVLAMPLVLVLSLGFRYGLRRRLHRQRRLGAAMSDVIAVGGEHSIAELVTQLRREPYSGLRVVAACVVEHPVPGAQDEGGRVPPVPRSLIDLGVQVVHGIDEIAETASRLGAAAVAVTSSAELTPARLRRLSWQLEGTDIDLIVAPGLMEVAGPRLHIRPVTGLPLLHVEEPEFTGARRVVKGAVDRILAGAALLVLSPIFAVIALAIRWDSRGPVFFRQTRVGKDGSVFTMIKFRTMVVDADRRRVELEQHNDHDSGPLFKMRNDPRITRVGRVLRKFSLDELPQLINVLIGSMSLVGPRPPLPSEVAQYDDDVRRRLLVKPGLTGLWQISGRADLTWEESVRLDLRYVENWSLMVDVMIMWKTVFAVARGSGAY